MGSTAPRSRFLNTFSGLLLLLGACAQSMDGEDGGPEGDEPGDKPFAGTLDGGSEGRGPSGQPTWSADGGDAGAKATNGGGTTTGGTTTGGTTTGGGTTGGGTGGATGSTTTTGGGTSTTTGGGISTTTTGGGTTTTGGGTSTAGGGTSTTGGATTGGTTGGSAPCLLISEYLEGASNTKALEIWNCGTTSVSLDDYGLCAARNSATSCTNLAMLSGTLAPGAVTLACHTQLASNTSFPRRSQCSVALTTVDFNGNDRIALYRDTNHSDTITSSDALVDSFGRLDQSPPAGVPASSGATPWQDQAFRRKNCSPYLSTGTFDTADRYDAATATDLSNLGVAPSFSCP